MISAFETPRRDCVETPCGESRAGLTRSSDAVSSKYQHWTSWNFGFIWVGLARADQVDPGSRAAARRLGYAGVEAYQAGDFATACDKLDRAYQVLRVPTLGMWSARCLAKQGKLVAASERYLEVQRLDVSGDAAVQKRAQAESARDLEKLSSRIPTLQLRIDGRPPNDVRVTIDDVAVAPSLVGENRPIDPGAHRVAAMAGTARVDSTVTVGEGEQKAVVLKLPPGRPAESAPVANPEVSNAPAAAPVDVTANDASSPQTARVVGWTALGVGAAGVAVGGLATVMMLSKQSSIGTCPNNICSSEQRGNVNSYNTWRTVSSVGFIAGGVLAATGATLVFVFHGDEQRSTALLVGPQSVELSGWF